MGCHLSMVPKAPKRGMGAWVGENKNPTLVEKWINFREWVRQNHGRNTKVVPISVKPDKVGAAANSEGRTEAKAANQADDTRTSIRQASKSDIVVAQWLLQHEMIMDTRSYSPLPGTTRPKAAKGQRTVLPPLVEPGTLPGAVPTDDEVMIEYDAYEFNNDRISGRLGEKLLSRTRELDDTQLDEDMRHSGDRRELRKTNPKKNSTYFDSELEQPKTNAYPQDGLDAWMRRMLAQQ